MSENNLTFFISFKSNVRLILTWQLVGGLAAHAWLLADIEFGHCVNVAFTENKKSEWLKRLSEGFHKRNTIFVLTLQIWYRRLACFQQAEHPKMMNKCGLKWKEIAVDSARIRVDDSMEYLESTRRFQIFRLPVSDVRFFGKTPRLITSYCSQDSDSCDF